jgi:hypothetical protein
MIKFGSFLETRIFQMLFNIVFLSFISVVLTAPISPKATAAGLLLASGLTSAFHIGPVFPGSRSSLKKATRHTAVDSSFSGSLQTVPRNTVLFEGNDSYGAENEDEIVPFVLSEDFYQVRQSYTNC